MAIGEMENGSGTCKACFFSISKSETQ